MVIAAVVEQGDFSNVACDGARDDATAQSRCAVLAGACSAACATHVPPWR